MKRTDNQYLETLSINVPEPVIVDSAITTGYGTRLSDLYNAIAFLPFTNPDEFGQDYSGNDFLFERTGAGSFQYTDLESSVHRNAISFDGTRYLAYRSSPLNSLITDTLTVGLWFKKASAPTDRDQCLFSIQDTGVHNGVKITLTQTTGQVRVQSTIDYSVEWNALSTAGYCDDEWHHLLVVIGPNAGNVIYVDGIATPVSYTTGNSSDYVIALNTNSIFVGTLNGAEVYAGELSDFFLSNQEYTATQANQLFLAGSREEGYYALDRPLVVPSVSSPSVSKPFLIAQTTGSISIPNDNDIRVFLNSVVASQGGITHVGPAGQFKLNGPAGVYVFVLELAFDGNSNGYRELFLYDVDNNGSSGRITLSNQGLKDVYLNSVAYYIHDGLGERTLEMKTRQNSGGTLPLVGNARALVYKL